MFTISKNETTLAYPKHQKQEVHVLSAGSLLQVVDNADYRDLSSAEEVEHRLYQKGYRLLPGSTPVIKTFEGDTHVVPTRFKLLVELGHQLFIVDGINAVSQYRTFMEKFGSCIAVLPAIVFPGEQPAQNNVTKYNLLRGH